MKTRLFLAVAFILAPAVVISAALAPMGGTLARCIPTFSDEIGYWNEIDCFRVAGFNAGYTCMDELVARATWSHFGTHGPGFAVLYGIPARMIGWHPASGPFFNLFFLAVASLVWILAVRPDTRTLIVGTLLMGSFFPLLLYIPTLMQEGLHFAFALLIAAAVQPWTADQPTKGRLWVPLLVIGFASLIRVTWALTLIPWAILAALRLRWWRGAVLLVGVALTVAGLFVLSEYLLSPYPRLITTFAQIVREFVKETPYRKWLDLAHNRPWLELKEHASNGWFLFSNTSGRIIEVAPRFEEMTLTGITALGIFLVPASRRACAFASINLLLIGLPLLFFYIREMERFIGPHVLLSLLVLLASGIDGRRMVIAVVVFQLGLLPFGWNYYREYHEPRLQADPAAAVEDFQDLEFDPAASPWDNTILVATKSVDYRCLALPRGIGMSSMIETDLPGLSITPLVDWHKADPKSRYVLLSQFVRDKDRARWHLRFIRNTPSGELYSTR
jgi:hypothetical protein